MCFHKPNLTTPNSGFSWFRRPRADSREDHSRDVSPAEPETSHGDVTTDPGRPASSSPTLGEDDTYYEISDVNNADDVKKQENNYDSLHPYANADADRTPYMELAVFSRSHHIVK
ncbi:hypothetical protein V1264_019847 [Littorina saxatilis]|uniref:Uncharacterized protein n=1 Tax=Littorina saxatilis TaxID=31220 RepID=A0AAN9BAC3_9CAEN